MQPNSWLSSGDIVSVTLTNSTINNSTNSIVLQTGHGAKLPNPDPSTGGGPFYLFFMPNATAGTSGEFVYITAKVGDTLTTGSDPYSTSTTGRGALIPTALDGTPLFPATNHEANATLQLRNVSPYIKQLQGALDLHVHSGAAGQGPVLTQQQGTNTVVLVNSTGSPITPGKLVRFHTTAGDLAIPAAGYFAGPVGVTVDPAGTHPSTSTYSTINGASAYVNTRGPVYVSVSGSVAQYDLVKSAGSGAVATALSTDANIIGQALTASTGSPPYARVLLFDRAADVATLSGIQNLANKRFTTATEIAAAATVTKDNTSGAAAGYGHLTLRGSSDNNQQVNIGYRTDQDYGYISAAKFGTGYKPLMLQEPAGGYAGIGVRQPQIKLALESGHDFGVEMPAPTSLAAIGSNTGGSLNGTYYYTVVAQDVRGGLTLQSTEASAAVSTAGSVLLRWNRVLGAVTYYVFRGGTSGGQNLRRQTSGMNCHLLDTDNASWASVAPPTVCTAYTNKFSYQGASNMSSGYGLFLGHGVTSRGYVHAQVGPTYLSAIQTPAAPAVVSVGTAGSTPFTYYIAAKDAAGNSTFISPGTTFATSRNNLATVSDVSNFNRLSWAGLEGAVTYDVVRYAGSGTYKLVGTNITNTWFDDLGGSISDYTFATANNTGDLYLDNEARLQAGVGVNGGTTTGFYRAQLKGMYGGAETVLRINSWGNGATDLASIVLANAGNAPVLAIYSTATGSAQRIGSYGPLDFCVDTGVGFTNAGLRMTVGQTNVNVVGHASGTNGALSVTQSGTGLGFGYGIKLADAGSKYWDICMANGALGDLYFSAQGSSNNLVVCNNPATGVFVAQKFGIGRAPTAGALDVFQQAGTLSSGIRVQRTGSSNYWDLSQLTNDTLALGLTGTARVVFGNSGLATGSGSNMSSFVPSACLHVKQQSQALGQGVRIEDSASTNAYEGYFSTSNNFLFVFANTPRTAWAINYNGGMQVNVADPGHFGFTVKQLADTLGYGLKLLSNANHYFQWTVTGTASMQMDYDGSAKWYIDGSNGALGIGVNPGNANILDIVQTVNNNGGGIRLRETPVGAGFYTDLYKQATTHKFLIQNNAGGDYIAIGNDTTVNNAVLYVNGPLYTAGNIYMSGTLVATSDKTRKKNIKNLAGALSKVTALQGVSFNWKSKEQSPDRQVGLIAQDVEPVLPELVVKANDLEGDHLALNYMGMIPYLVEAVKELAAEVKSLKAKLGES